MRHSIARAVLALATSFAACAGAATLVPAKGQSPEQVEADTAVCQSQASQAAATPPATGQQQGGRLRGAAAGAAAAEVRGNQHANYDRIDDDLKEEYRRNEAREAAAAGAVVGGSRQRRERRQGAQQQQAAQQQAGSDAFNSCMTSKGYTLNP